MKNGKSCYVEIDGYAAQWLRNLISRGLIADGDVKECSVLDIAPRDLAAYSQVHLYAGIGVWSYSLRRAGIPDTANIWTFSEPCQPFSAAGKGLGFADDRYLRPYTNHLIEQCRPPICLGEQVASNDGLGWLDVVQTDFERARYACGAVDTCSASVGAPHIRQRLRVCAVASEFGEEWLANSENQRHTWIDGKSGDRAPLEFERSGLAGELVYAEPGGVERMANAARLGRGERGQDVAGCGERSGSQGLEQRLGDGSIRRNSRAGPTNGHWSNADWLFCRDGKWRPVESSPQPMVDGSAESLGRVRPEIVEAIKEEINASPMESQIRSAATMRALQDHLGTQARQLWTPGRLPRLHEAPFLLAFLRQLSEQGRPITQGASLSCEETSAGILRSVRGDEALACPSCKRELAGQRPGECANPVHILSSILARYAPEAWSDSYQTYAEIGFPLGHNCRDRTGRLRAYGNAVDAEATTDFCRNVGEVLGLI